MKSFNLTVLQHTFKHCVKYSTKLCLELYCAVTMFKRVPQQLTWLINNLHTVANDLCAGNTPNRVSHSVTVDKWRGRKVSANSNALYCTLLALVWIQCCGSEQGFDSWTNTNRLNGDNYLVLISWRLCRLIGVCLISACGIVPGSGHVCLHFAVGVGLSGECTQGWRCLLEICINRRKTYVFCVNGTKNAYSIT